MTPPISACVIARDAERTLERCLASLAWVDECVVVVDDRSFDASEAIARESGARVLRHRYEGNVEQKNFALSQVKHDWVLSLDADEALSVELSARLQELLTRQSQARDRCDGVERIVDLDETDSALGKLLVDPHFMREWERR